MRRLRLTVAGHRPNMADATAYRNVTACSYAALRYTVRFRWRASTLVRSLGRMKNVLAEWLRLNGGPSAKRKLQLLIEDRTGKPMRWATLHDVAELDYAKPDVKPPGLDIAKRIEAGTDGEVSAAALLGLAPQVLSPKRRAARSRR